MADGALDGVAGIALGVLATAGRGARNELTVDGIRGDAGLQCTADPSPFTSGLGAIDAD